MMPGDSIFHCSREEGVGLEQVVVDVLGIVVSQGVPGHQGVLRKLLEDGIQLLERLVLVAIVLLPPLVVLIAALLGLDLVHLGLKLFLLLLLCGVQLFLGFLFLRVLVRHLQLVQLLLIIVANDLRQAITVLSVESEHNAGQLVLLLEVRDEAWELGLDVPRLLRQLAVLL